MNPKLKQTYSIAMLVIAIGMICAAFMLDTGTSLPLDQCRRENEAWYGCGADADCKIIGNPCGWPNDAAAVSSAAEAETCNRHLGAAMGCVAYDAARDGTFKAVCQQGACVAQPAGTP